MEYYYSQQDSKWGGMKLGNSGLSMRDFGCVVTSCAMMLSYFLDRKVLPSELCSWLNKHNGFTYDGLLYWNKITEFSGGRLRKFDSPQEDGKMVTYGIRQVILGRYNHWIIDHPRKSGQIIDPLNGVEKEYSGYNYTKRVRFFSGIPVEAIRYAVDNRYGLKRSWKTYLEEKAVGLALSPRGIYIRRKIKRLPSDREIKGIVYGAHDFGTIFENKYGNQWLSVRKSGLN